MESKYKKIYFLKNRVLKSFFFYKKVANLGQPHLATGGEQTLEELRSHSSQEMREKKAKLQKMMDKKKKQERRKREKADLAEERCGYT